MTELKKKIVTVSMLILAIIINILLLLRNESLDFDQIAGFSLTMCGVLIFILFIFLKGNKKKCKILIIPCIFPIPICIMAILKYTTELITLLYIAMLAMFLWLFVYFYRGCNKGNLD